MKQIKERKKKKVVVCLVCLVCLSVYTVMVDFTFPGLYRPLSQGLLFFVSCFFSFGFRFIFYRNLHLSLFFLFLFVSPLVFCFPRCSTAQGCILYYLFTHYLLLTTYYLPLGCGCLLPITYITHYFFLFIVYCL